MRAVIRTALLASIVALTLAMVAPARAQRTGDHIVPAIETVCEGDPYNFGLCNSYCEALDCESATPIGTPRACSNLLKTYTKKSGGDLPACACPCAFDFEGDIATMVAWGANRVIPISIDPLATGISYCDGGPFPSVPDAFIFEAFEVVEEGNSPLGGRLFYWVEDPVGQTAGTCNVLGLGVDGLENFPGSEGQFILPVPPAINDEVPQILGTPVTQNEADACRALLRIAFNCPAD